MVTYLTVLAAKLLLTTHCRGLIIAEPSFLFFEEDKDFIPLSVTCEVPIVWQNTRYNTVYIHRNGVRLGEAVPGSPPMLKQNMNGASIYGNVSTSITLNMTQASCWDGGEYLCLIVHTAPGSQPRENREYQKVLVSVKPGRKVVMEVSPIKKEYLKNDIVQLSCSGLIGGSPTSSRIQWIWEYMNYNQWIKFTGSKIVNDPPVSVNITCQYRQVSNITLALTLGDNNRIYRCYLAWDGNVNTNNPPTYVFTVIGGADVAAWIIIVAVIGGVILCLVILFVIFFYRRRHNKKEDSTKETKVAPQYDDEVASVFRPSVVEKMNKLLYLRPKFDWESDRGSTVDADDTSSRSSLEIKEQQVMFDN